MRVNVSGHERTEILRGWVARVYHLQRYIRSGQFFKEATAEITTWLGGWLNSIRVDHVLGVGGLFTKTWNWVAKLKRITAFVFNWVLIGAWANETLGDCFGSYGQNLAGKASLRFAVTKVNNENVGALMVLLLYQKDCKRIKRIGAINCGLFLLVFSLTDYVVDKAHR